MESDGYYAKIIADSVNEYNQRLTTLEVRYPRFIHAEILTHRDRARNSASSRAIPWPKMMANISHDPVIPIKFGLEQRGMQSGDELPPQLSEHAKKLWLEGRDYMVKLADRLHNIGRDYNDCNREQFTKEFEDVKVHKSIPNRLTEPWMWITVVMTATDWKNFFRLRCHQDAEIHFQKIANLMRQTLDNNIPYLVMYADWHLPYTTEEEREAKPELDWKKISVARCARVSYLTHDGKRDVSQDLQLFDRLCQGSGFGHWSPHEHVACSSNQDVRSGPYRGWVQYRKLFDNECALE